MLFITKIVNFETAHAIHGYDGACKNIHGHSYELHLTVSCGRTGDEFLDNPGFILDFSVLNQIAQSVIPDFFDHKVILSREYLMHNPTMSSQENLVIWDIEPTAENMLVFIQKNLQKKLSPPIELTELRLFETRDSYATWKNT